jgi:hypothetical protein
MLRIVLLYTRELLEPWLVNINGETQPWGAETNTENHREVNSDRFGAMHAPSQDTENKLFALAELRRGNLVESPSSGRSFASPLTRGLLDILEPGG